MPYFSTKDSPNDFLECQRIPPLPLGSSIFRHRDECIRIAKWCSGTTGLGNGGIWLDIKNNQRTLVPLGSWIVKAPSGEYWWYTDEEFIKKFPYEKLDAVAAD